MLRALVISDEVWDAILAGLLVGPDELVILDTETNIDTKCGFEAVMELARQSKHWNDFLKTDDDIENIRKHAYDAGMEDAH